jgi:cytoplasmic iron level regulating protein YaaA (DUF328/UPF0246 family)
MLIVLSPAKSLDFESPVPAVDASEPEFAADARKLVRQLRELAPAEIATLMAVSDPLAALNAARYTSFGTRATRAAQRPAVLAFDGDVYTGLDARGLDASALLFAQRHVRILSGLYGLLRPLDLIRPHRLEMGTRLANERGRDLYDWWGARPARALRRDMRRLGHDVLVNLASQEYFRAVDCAALDVPVIQPVFQERRAGGWKVISFDAKRARGRMTRFAIDRRLTDPEALKGFDADGYRFDRSASSASTWYFRRSAR